MPTGDESAAEALIQDGISVSSLTSSVDMEITRKKSGINTQRNVTITSGHVVINAGKDGISVDSTGIDIQGSLNIFASNFAIVALGGPVTITGDMIIRGR